MGDLINIFVSSNVFFSACIGIFWMLLFLQSGIDKLIDWKGNLSWLEGHFANSILASFVKPMLATLMIFEIIAGGASFMGVVILFISGSTTWLSLGLYISIICLLMLFFGQRLAKDYEGAKTIAIYFGVALISVIMLNA